MIFIDFSKILYIGVPVIMSNPHFYEASKQYLSAVDGLNPKAELHESYVDLEPVSSQLITSLNHYIFINN